MITPHAQWTIDRTRERIAKRREERPANDEMVQGFLDGYDLNAPEPSDNRSHSYRHGFANGRDDRANKPRANAAELRQMADLAMERDINIEAAAKDEANG